LPDYIETYCGECGLKKLMVKKSEKTGKPYKQNPDYSFHTIPINREGETKTAWIHIESQEHKAYVQEHKSSEGFTLTQPHFTKEEMTKLEKPLTLESSPTKAATQKVATQTEADALNKFSKDTIKETADKDILNNWTQMIRGAYTNAIQINKDATGAEKDTRISTQGFIQNFALFYSNIKLTKAIEKLASAVEKNGT